MKILCGARRRSRDRILRPGSNLSGRCRNAVVRGKTRCRLHGGHRIGHSKPGFDTSAAMAGQRRWLARLHAMGLKRPYHPRLKLEQVPTMAEEAKIILHQAQQELEEILPKDILLRPVESLSSAHALGRANLSGIHQLVRIIEQPLDIRVGDPKLVPPPKVDELKLQRLVGDMANVVFNNLRRAAKDQTDGNGLAELLAEIRAEKAAKKEKPQ